MSRRLHARVNGAGPTGALCALALAAAGWRVTLHDPLEPEALLARERAYALTHSSQRLLRRLGLWEVLRPTLAPFRLLRLRDLAVGAAATFDGRDLGPRPGNGPDAAVGWIGRHRALLAVLLQRLAADPAVTLQLGGATAPPLAAAPDLVVAADGPGSPTRAALGIGCWQHRYRQACLTVQVQLRGCADDEAWELLRPEGPFAVLPLGEGGFQLVWSAAAERCRRREQLSDSAFLDALAGVLPEPLQPDGLLEPPRSVPVGLLLARRLHRGSTVLVGESGHRCHPVGGQGLNLCWRDVAVLQRLAQRAAAGHLAPGRIGAAYAWRRWPDLLLTLLATDLLMRLFSNRSPLLLPLRRLGLLALSRVGTLRRLVLSAMTDGPCSWPGTSTKWGDGDQYLSPAAACRSPAALSAPSGGARGERS